MKTLPMMILTLLLAGCGAKKIQANLTTCSAELDTCKTALANTPKAQPPKIVFLDARLGAYRALAKQFREAFGTSDLSIILRDGRMVVQLPNQVLFDSGKAVLSDSGKTTLDQVASVLKQHPKRRFLVAGHTDDVAVKAGARFKDNWELSALRATTAAKYLESKGVDPRQFGAAGFGPNLPSAANSSVEGKAGNRRLEIILFPTVDELPKFPKTL